MRDIADMEESGVLTEEEQAAGWLWCEEFDYLLVNAVTDSHCKLMGYMCGYCNQFKEIQS